MLNWPWGAPPARYYSPNAIVALLAAEDVDGWVARTAERLHVPPDELTDPLLARQRSWHAQRQLDQLLVAEQRDHDRLHSDPYWAALRHLPGSPGQEYFRHLLDATGTTAERAQVAEVLAAHDGHAFCWSWHLTPTARERYRRFIQDLNIEALRGRVESAARLLRTRPPDPSVTLANAWTVRELLHDEALRGRARIERYQSDLRMLPARRLRARRDLQLEIAAEQAGLDRIAERLQEVREFQEHLDQLRTRRRLWEAQPDHVEVLAAGELSAERLQLLEFGALLHLEAAPPPYLQATISQPFSPKEPVARRAWLKAAWTIERLRADCGISDPDVAIGLEPKQADARHLYDLVHQTLTVLRRDLGRLRAAGGHRKEVAMDLTDELGTCLFDGLQL